MNRQELILRKQELAHNPTARLPVSLVLDVSGSMHGEPLSELQEGVMMFFNAVRSDEMASLSADISVVTFDCEARLALDFYSVERQVVPRLNAQGTTSMGAGVNMALDLLDARKQEYQTMGVDYYQPWMVLMTDGAPTDDIQGASRRVVERVQQRKLSVFPIGIGAGANMQCLQMFSPNRPPLRLKGLNFREFFIWLSMSMSRVSQSQPGDEVALDVAGINAWGTI